MDLGAGVGGRRTQEEASQDQGRCPLNTHRQGVDEVHLFWEAALAQKVASLGGFFQKETAVKPVGLTQVFLIVSSVLWSCLHCPQSSCPAERGWDRVRAPDRPVWAS